MLIFSHPHVHRNAQTSTARNNYAHTLKIKIKLRHFIVNIEYHHLFKEGYTYLQGTNQIVIEFIEKLSAVQKCLKLPNN